MFADRRGRQRAPLERADQCNRMADNFAKEINRAVQAKDAVRAGLDGLRTSLAGRGT